MDDEKQIEKKIFQGMIGKKVKTITKTKKGVISIYLSNGQVLVFSKASYVYRED